VKSIKEEFKNMWAPQMSLFNVMADVKSSYQSEYATAEQQQQQQEFAAIMQAHEADREKSYEHSSKTSSLRSNMVKTQSDRMSEVLGP